jgi:DNA invertase Pin-like site-specific DNA recombinase
MGIMAVGVYLRVSSTTQSVASQRREIERYLAGQNVDDARWYIDEGVSGSIMVRPALEKLKQAIFLGQVNTVVVYSLDRLARNAIEGLNLIAGWLQHQVRLVVITTQMDFSGEVGQMVASLLLHIAQMERTRIRERQAAGIAAARADGKRWGGRKCGVGLKADPDRVAELRRRGLSNAEIAAALNISTRTVMRYIKRACGDDRAKRNPG